MQSPPRAGGLEAGKQKITPPNEFLRSERWQSGDRKNVPDALFKPKPSRQICEPLEIKKRTRSSSAFFSWWTRRESNPCPKPRPVGVYERSFRFQCRSGARPETGFLETHPRLFRPSPRGIAEASSLWLSGLDTNCRVSKRLGWD
jgi:hypothetical protein